jgi:hypothetical protein
MRKPIKLALANITEGHAVARQVEGLLESKLTDAGMKKMIPMFVSGKEPNETHDCGHCSMFVPSKSACTIVEGVIKANGTCAYQDPSNEYAKPEDEHSMKMTKDQAQYAEMPEGTPINCGTCMFLKGTTCKLWMGEVKKNDCCMAHDSKSYK